MAHDYPATFHERVVATNTVMGYLPRLYEIYRDAKKYITDKVLVNEKEVKLARYKMPKLPSHKLLRNIYPDAFSWLDVKVD